MQSLCTECEDVNARLEEESGLPDDTICKDRSDSSKCSTNRAEYFPP